ncbi:hypothetical protein [Streptomyces justiciae]|uniref:Uncharacterized protein n=1 Tax=Streptomyces justiciae TaxID=2780140 RepID=A0ABU3M6U1_9ACTN|nr:hypothetical protein [Streptomyces justiciae]MDT7847235.1 hypothetical protein [Streptomyces justiciae]
MTEFTWKPDVSPCVQRPEEAYVGPVDACRAMEVDGQVIRIRGAGELSEESRAALTDLVRVATRCFAEDQAAIVQQVNDLRRAWLKAGPPPIGTPLARWWDARLIALREALRAPSNARSQPGDPPHVSMERWVLQLLGVLADLDRCQHGRHEGDPCGSCGGVSTGNPCLADGRVLGYGPYGNPIVLPGRDHKTDPAAWRATKEKNS